MTSGEPRAYMRQPAIEPRTRPITKDFNKRDLSFRLVLEDSTPLPPGSKTAVAGIIRLSARCTPNVKLLHWHISAYI